MRLGLLVPEVPGHLNPMATLGATLARRGHEVAVLAAARAEPTVRRLGLGFVRLGDDVYDRRVTATIDRLGRATGLAAIRPTIELGNLATAMMLADVPGQLGGFDGLVVDQVLPVGGALAERAGLPYVVACNALTVTLDRTCPPPMALWRPRRDAFGRVRNAVTNALLPPIVGWLGRARTTGIDPLYLVGGRNRARAIVTQTPALFDFPRDLPRGFHHTAPWHTPGRDAGDDFPWEQLDGRPLVYASMGTLQNAVPRVFTAIAESVRGLDVQLVLTHGGAPGPLTEAVPDNVLVVRRALQLALLARAAAAITHAGLNSALECLAAGVPMVCVPVTNDQPGVAMRAQALGVAEVLPVGRITAARLRSLLARVLTDPTIRRRAETVKAELAALDGPAMAAEIIDRALTLDATP